MKWQVLQLGDAVRFVGGGTPSKNNPEFWGGSIPWASVKDIKGPILDQTVDSITEAGLANSASRLLPAGTVVIPTRMALGKAAITARPVAINQDLKGVLPIADVSSPYLFHFFQSQSEALERMGEGATVKGITIEKLSRLELPLPTLDEQRRIAAVLDKADALRRQRQESLHLTEKLLQSVFIDLFGSELKPTCPRVKLKNHLDFLTSGGRGWAKYYSESGDKFIRSMDVQMNEISDSEMICVTAPKNAEAERTRVSAGDVLLTITGSLIGRVAAVTAAHAGSYVSQHVAILRTRGFHPEFLAWAISTDEGQRQIQKNQTGQTKPGLNFEQIGRITVPRPTPELEERFVQLVRQRLAIMAEQRRALAQAKNLFSSLQQRAFRGDLDLSRMRLEEEISAVTQGTDELPEPTLPTQPETSGPKSRHFTADAATNRKLKTLREQAAKKGQIPWHKDYFHHVLVGERKGTFRAGDILVQSQIFEEDTRPKDEKLVKHLLELLAPLSGPPLLRQRFDHNPKAANASEQGTQEMVLEHVP